MDSPSDSSSGSGSGNASRPSDKACALPAPVLAADLHSWRAALLALALAVLALGPALLPGRALLPQDPRGLSPWVEELSESEAAAVAETNRAAVPHRADKLLQFLPFDTAVGRAWREGRVPGWEPGVLCGIPLIGQGTSRAFYPTALVFAFVPPERAYAWIYLVHLVLGGTFLYRVARRWGAAEAGALFGTASFTLSGYALAHLHHPMIFLAAVWVLPALEATTVLASPRYATLAKSVDKRTPGAVLGLAVVTALSWLAGFPQASVLLCYLVAGLAGLYALEDLRGGRGLPMRRLALVGAGLALGIALAAVQILPMLEMSGLSSREPGTLELLEQRAMPPAFALDLVLPGQLSAPGDARLDVESASKPTFLALATTPLAKAEPLAAGVFNHTEVALGFGLWALVFALASLARLRRCGARTETVFLWGFGLFGLAIALGAPGVSRLALALPGFAAGDFKRLLLLPAVAGPLLAALGWRALSARLLVLLSVPGTLSLLAAWRVQTLATDEFAAEWAARITPRIGAPVEAFLSVLAPGEAAFNQELLGRGLLLAGLALTLAPLLVGLARGRGALAIFAGLTALELLPLAWDLSPAPPAGAFDTPPALVAAALEHGAGRPVPPRLVRLEPPAPGEVRALTDVRLLPPDLPSVFGLHDATGYAPLPPRHVEELFARIEPNATSHGAGLGTLRDPASLTSSAFALLAADLVLTTEAELPRSKSNGWNLLAERGDTRLFAADEDVARARLRPLPADLVPPAPDVLDAVRAPGSAEIESYAPGRIALRTRSAEPAWLEVAETWHPRWTATVDGEVSVVRRSNVAFVGLALPSGEHAVELHYADGRLGSAVSCLALIGLVLVALRARRRVANTPPAAM